MSGKKPKERDSYVLRMIDGSLVEVSRDVYLEWYQSKRRERYQLERDQKHGVCSLNELEEKNEICDLSINVEKTVFRNICQEKMRDVLSKLSTEDAILIEMLYFREDTVADVAQIFRCNRKTIQNRRKKILDKLCWIMRKEGIRSSSL